MEERQASRFTMLRLREQEMGARRRKRIGGSKGKLRAKYEEEICRVEVFQEGVGAVVACRNV